MKKDFQKFLLVILSITLCIAGLIALASQEDIEDNDMVVHTGELTELKRGDRGDEVKALQTRLRDIYYYTGKVTGNYLDATMKAVKSVQEAYGLEQTGVADRATLEIIYGDAHRPLEKGNYGKDVSRLQTRLSELGYYHDKISTKYLNNTQNAVTAFQKDNGLEVTGKADVATQIKLYSDNVYHVTPDPNATPAPSPEPTAPPDLTYPGKLSYGSQRERVKQLQERLQELGYFTGRKITTGFYRQTQAALKEFQKQNGLENNGIVDEMTWQALYASDVARPHDPPKPSPVPTPPPYFLEVDVTNQVVKVYEMDEEGNYTRFVRAMWCSTGKGSYPSKIDTFTLTERRSRGASFPNWGGGTARYWVRINPTDAFHSVLYSSDQKTVNMKSVNNLGRRASHGCIRLTLQDAKWIYLNCGPGTQVKTHEDAQPDPELKAAHKPGTFSKQLNAHPITPTPSIPPVYDATYPTGELRKISENKRGENVFWLQSRLKELGYYTGTVTGTYLGGTKKAVKAFQRAQGLTQTGVADVRTLELLYRDLPVATPVPTPLPTDVPETPAP